MYPIKFLMLYIFISFLASASGVTYSGRLIDPNGTPVTSSNVQFRIQIRTPGNENCLMYEEIQNKDMTNSDGVFSITINDGTGSRTDSTGFGLDQLFANRGSFIFPATYCVIGANYAPNATDGRKLQVYFNDGSFATGQWEPTPSMAINFIPMAIESQQVGGYKKEQLLKIADGVSTTGTELDTTKWTNLLALINGTSTAYTKPTDQVTQLYGATVPTPSNGQSIRWNSTLNAGAGGWENFTAGTASAVTTVSSANADIAVANGSTTPQLTLNSGTGANQIVKLDGTAKLPAVDGSALTNVNASKVGGTTVSLASLANGQVLKYNGTNWANASDADTLGGLSCANGRVAYYTGGSWACLEVTSTSTINTIVSRDATGESVFGSLNTGTLKINDGATGTISLTTPVAVTSYSMRLPATVGNTGEVLTTDGGSPAQLSWSPMTSSQWLNNGSKIYYNLGEIGIGTINPSATLHVVQANASGNMPKVLNVVGGNSTTAGGTGSPISLTAGSGNSTGGGGAITLVAGSGNGGGGASLSLSGGNYAGGALTMAAGVSGGGGGGTVSISAGAGNGAGTGTGGAVNLTGGAGTNGYSGGDLVLNGGAKSAPGVDGNVLLANIRGNVGIGTAAPSARLYVKTAAVQTNSIFESNCSGCSSLINVYNSASIVGNSNSGIQFSVANTADIYASIVGIPFNGSNGILSFATNSGGSVTEKMRIDYAGNVGIGASNPTQKLQVGTSGDGSVAIANSWTTFSDKRLKKEFSKIPDACEKIDSLNGYYYYWKNKEDKSRQIGVIAQEVELVLPEIVKTNEEGVKSVDYSKLSAVLIESNKELNARLKYLESENENLKKRFEKLEKYFSK